MKRQAKKRRDTRVAAAFVISLFLHLLVLIPGLVFMLKTDTSSPPKRDRPYQVELTALPQRPPPKRREVPVDPEVKERRTPKRQTPTPRKKKVKKDTRPQPQKAKKEKEKKKRREKKEKKEKRLQRKKFQFKRKMVHQENSEDELAPKDFRFWAQKNRNVKEETRARKTQLTVDPSKKKALAKGKKKRIGHNVPTPRPRRSPRAARPRTRPRPTRKPRDHKRRKLQPRKAKPHEKKEKRLAAKRRPRTRPKQRKKKQPTPRTGPLRMRARRRPKPQKERTKLGHHPAGRRPSEAQPKKSSESRAQKRSRRPKRLVDVKIKPSDGLINKLFAKKWVSQARKNPDPHRKSSKGQASTHPSARRWKKIKAAVENYVAEVRPGRVTALRTRAHPFAKYITAVHRNIHPLWGDGFLVDWSAKSPDDPMNKRDRWAMAEMVINPDGTLHKAGLVKSSGYLPYDAAAMDVVFSAAPFVKAPKKILSADGKVYLHWRFHRDHRQCGTFGVDAYILTSPPKGGHTDKAYAKGLSDRVKWDPARSLKRLRRRGGGASDRGRQVRVTETPRGGEGSNHRYAPPARRRRESGAGGGQSREKGSRDRGSGGASRRRKTLETVSSSSASRTVKLWIRALWKKDIRWLVRLSRLPFKAQGRVIAKTKKQLEAAYKGLLGDSKSAKKAGNRSAKVRLYTPSGLRKRLGRLPKGLTPETSAVYATTRIGGGVVVLVLKPDGSTYRVTGLFR